MAGEWIKIRVDLHDDPAVIWVSQQTGLPCMHVVGHLHALWSWASRQCNEGTVTGVTLCALQDVIKHDKIPHLLVKIGWLEYDDTGELPIIRFPKWDRHNSESAKTRALTAERVRRHRRETCNASSVTQALPEQEQEKRRNTRSMQEGVDRKREGEETREARGNVRSTGKQTRNHAKSKSRGNGAGRMRTAVTVEAIEGTATAIFKACKYAGDQGGNLWGVAALLETGIGDLSEREVFDAANGAALNGKDKPAHFFATLSETLAKRGADLTQLLRQVAIVPEWPKAHPHAGV